MPNAVTHILIPIILVDLIRDYRLKDKNYITTNHLLIAGIAGMLPDIDVAFGLVLTFINGSSPMIFHRLITHSLLIPALLLIMAMTAHYTKRLETYKILLMLTIGITIHLILDFLLIGSIMPLYPFSTKEIGLNLTTGNTAGVLMLALDTIILLAWLIHEQLKHRIIDYI